MADDDRPLEPERVDGGSRLGDALERLAFGPGRRTYQQAIGALFVATGALVALWLVDRFAPTVLGLDAGTGGLLEAAAAIAVALFALTGVVQVLLYARGLQRREAVVVEAADRVAESAEQVEGTAEEIGGAAEAVDDEGGEVRAEAETAAERAAEARDAAGEVAEELEGPDDRQEGDGPGGGD